MELTTIRVPITSDNLPKGHWFEDDGSVWRAIKCDPRTQGCEWRWQPLNWTAFAKSEPTSEMLDVYLPPDLAERLGATSQH